MGLLICFPFPIRNDVRVSLKPTLAGLLNALPHFPIVGIANVSNAATQNSNRKSSPPISLPNVLVRPNYSGNCAVNDAAPYFYEASSTDSIASFTAEARIIDDFGISEVTGGTEGFTSWARHYLRLSSD